MYTELIIVSNLLALGSVLTPPGGTILDDVDKLLQDYQSTTQLVLTSVQDNIKLIHDKLADIGNTAHILAIADLNAIRADALKKLADLEDSNRSKGIDVTFCTQYTAEKTNTKTDSLLNLLTQCVEYRVEEYYLRTRPVFNDVHTTIVPVTVYQNQVDECKVAGRVEECLIRVMLDISAKINFLPEMVQDGVDQANQMIDNFTPKFRECYLYQAEELSFHANVMYQNTLKCVQDIYWELSTEINNYY